MIQLSHIHYTSCEEPDIAISPRGQLIAFRCPSRNTGNDGNPNIHVYRTDGTLASALVNYQGSERGIAFWPDNSHVIVGGCGQPGNRKADGIKQWYLQDKSFEHRFSETPLTGLNIDLLGASRSGRYILANAPYQSTTWLFNTATNKRIETQRLDVGDKVLFCDSDRYVGATSYRGWGLGATGVVIDCSNGSVVWEGKDVLCFTSDARAFLVYDYPSLVSYDLETLTETPLVDLSSWSIEQKVTAGSFTYDGRRLAIGRLEEAYVYIVDPRDYRCLQKVPLISPGAGGSVGYVDSLRFNVQDELVVIQRLRLRSGRTETHVQVWKE